MTDKELYQYCQDVGAKARDWKKRFVALLPEVAKRNLYRKYGFASIVDFAGRLGGVGEYTVEVAMQLQKHINDKPALLNILPKVGVHKMRVVATIATKENQEILAKKVMEMSKPALQVWAREIRPRPEILQNPDSQKSLTEAQNSLFGNNRGFENFSDMSSVDERIHYSFDVDKKTDFKLRKYKQEMEKAIKRYATWCEVMQKLIKDKFDIANELCKEKISESNQMIQNPVNTTITNMSKSESDKKIVYASNTTRHIPAEIKRKIQNKYQGMCGYPGCNKPSTVLHHTKRFALSPNHENIIPLCAEHHEIIHTGWIKNENDSPEKWLKGLYDGINNAKEKIDQRVRLFSNFLNKTNHPGSPNTS